MTMDGLILADFSWLQFLQVNAVLMLA